MARMTPIPVDECEDPELARAFGHFTSTLGFVRATRHGVSEETMGAIYEYATSPLFTDAARVALDFALEAASHAG